LSWGHDFDLVVFREPGALTSSSGDEAAIHGGCDFRASEAQLLAELL